MQTAEGAGSGAAVSGRQRVFYAAVTALALWVGAFGFLAPAQVDWALPWLVPPMHARFLGAMYLSGASFMIGAIAARHWSTVRIVVLMCATWTGMLLLVSLFHLSQFDWRKQQVWIWFLAYSAFPLGAAAIAWRHRRVIATGPCRGVPHLLRRYLAVAGVLVVALAVALFVAPQALAAVWPWTITPMLAQIYSAPFLSYGLGGIVAARQQCYADVRLYLGATLVFTAGVLTASIVHRALFSAAQVSDWLWFAGFGGATLALAAGSALAFLPGYRTDDRLTTSLRGPTLGATPGGTPGGTPGPTGERPAGAGGAPTRNDILNDRQAIER